MWEFLFCKLHFDILFLSGFRNSHWSSLNFLFIIYYLPLIWRRRLLIFNFFIWVIIWMRLTRDRFGRNNYTVFFSENIRLLIFEIEFLYFFISFFLFFKFFLILVQRFLRIGCFLNLLFCLQLFILLLHIV